MLLSCFVVVCQSVSDAIIIFFKYVYYVSTGYGSGGSGVVVVVREGAAGI
jgi:hypothetical protein